MKKITKITSSLFFVLIVAFLIRMFTFGTKSQEMTNQMSYSNGKLASCPDKPNCVSSFQAENDSHYIAPVSLRETLLLKLEDYLTTQGCSKTKSEQGYWHYVCQSSIFGFVDDLELLYISDLKKLYFRSSSRVGYSDMGANRKRVQTLIKDLLKN